MRTLMLLAACVAAALLAGALLAYPLHAGVPPFSGMKFHKAIALTTELTAVAAIVLFVHATAGISRAHFGLAFTARSACRDIPIALLAGLVFLAALECLLMMLGVRVPAPSIDLSVEALSRALLVALAVGLLVAMIEEALFRGALWSGLEQGTNVVIALVVTSGLYAAVHFVKFKPMRPGVDVDWSTGPALLAEGLTRFSNPIIIDSFLTLFALGLLLGLIRLVRGHVAQCIGFHAGIVAGLRLAGDLTDHVPGTRFGFLVNRWDPERGWLALGMLVATIAGYGLWHRRRRA